MSFGVLIGKPIMVDLEFLSILGPIRRKIWVVDPLCIHGSVDVFPMSEGFRLRVHMEGGVNSHIPPPPIENSRGGGDDAANQSGGSNLHFMTSEWDGMGSECWELFKDTAAKSKD